MKKVTNPKLNIDIEIIREAQREAGIQIKHLNAAISYYSVQSKNARMKKGMQNMNIIDDTSAVDAVFCCSDNEKVKCPLKTELITRDECLDTSGSNGNECNGCEIGKRTKEKLLPNSES